MNIYSKGENMFEVIRQIESVSGNKVFGFNSENIYYSVTVDQNNNFWFKVSGAYHFGNGGLNAIVKHIEKLGIVLNENITAQKFFSEKRK